MDFSSLAKVSDKRTREIVRRANVQPAEVDYSDGYPFAYDVDTGKVQTIPFGDDTRVFVTAKSGQGKTLMVISLLSRFVTDKENNKVFMGNDVAEEAKNFYQTYGRQKMYDTLGRELIEGEDEEVLDEEDVEIVRPKFMDKHSKSYSDYFSFGFSDITEKEFKNLLGVGGWRDSQKDVFENVFVSYDFDSGSVKGLKEQFESYMERPNFDTRRKSTVQSVVSKLDNIKERKVISDRFSKSFFVDSFDSKVFSLDMKDIEKFDDRYVRFYSGVLHRNLINGLNEGRVEGNIWIFNDEFHMVAPKDEDSKVKTVFQQMMDFSGRRAEVSSVICTQRPSQVSNPVSDDDADFVTPCTHILIGPGLSWGQWKKVLKGTPMWSRGVMDDWRKVRNSLGIHEFILIDKSKHSLVNNSVRRGSSFQVLKALPPVTWYPV